MALNPNVKYVSGSIIRQAFNKGNFWQRALNGEFRTWTYYNTHYTRGKARQKGYQYCTNSQIVRYFDTSNKLIAVVHQIRNPDGTLGASGMPDPKYLDLGHQILKTRS